VRLARAARADDERRAWRRHGGAALGALVEDAERRASSATTAATARVSAARPTVTVKSNCSEKSPARMLPKLALKPGLCTGRCAASSLKAASQTKTGSG